MSLSRRPKTSDGLPLLLGTHVAANVRLLAGILPSLITPAAEHNSIGRIVHTSTGYVSQFRYTLEDVRRVPWTGVGAYTKAKTATEVFAFELDRRLKEAGRPVASLVVRPGIGVDAKTPQRPGIRDATTLYRRNPYTPWAQGKDTSAWSSVRALTDPAVRGGEYFSPNGRFRGEPVQILPLARTAEPGAESAARVWSQLEDLACVQLTL